ncbi:MAG: abortive infection family protein [Lachnospiraceae bacterium]|nr:abortive infection family protein [Lachnospiraceae bacterium]
MIFCDRYKELIDTENGEFKDYICGEIKFNIKRKIAEIMIEFAEPQIYRPSRYDKYEETTTALESALNILSDKLGYSLIPSCMISYRMEEIDYQLGCIFTPHLFSLIELQYNELSEQERTEFEKALNCLFGEKDIPWILHDGRFIKIDAKQFEIDLKAKSLLLMKELKGQEEVFQAPYNEMVAAIEFLEKGSYSEAIANAGKSYESVLKILCDVNRGNADKLTKQILETDICSIPGSMTRDGFREKVLMSLPYVRNNSTASHGSGKEVIEISMEMANLAINMAASLNTYLIESYIKNGINRKED